VASKIEWLKCSRSFVYFADSFCQIYDATAKEWVPFRLWKAQVDTAQVMLGAQLIVILKARQLGLSWLVLALALWLMLFQPAATILLFSKRDDEAVYLLDERLKGMYKRLPPWMQARNVTMDSKHEFALSNGSVARAFPTTGGDGYTATLAIVDEADLVDDLGKLLQAVKPTIDGGGLLSRVDKATPTSEFKNIYRSAKAGTSPWKAVFLPWHVRPNRDEAWYEAQKADSLARTTALDDLHESYPATDVEALAPKSLDKRIAADWLQQCYLEAEPIKPSDAPAIPGLIIYKAPEPGKTYVVGGDPAEGNPTSDDSAATVLELETGEEVASLCGKFQPSTFASHLDAIGVYYNRASLMVERNNHGHAVLLSLNGFSRLQRLRAYDNKEGWNTTETSKALLYSTGADAFRGGDTIIHSFASFTQLASISGSTLSAPEGEHDDRATGYVLALIGRTNPAVRGGGGLFR
jgi:hypothetical protein